MVKAVIVGSMLLALAACKPEQKATAPDEGSGPQIATSIDDYSLPVDRSDQVTAIDAATGDASGMPKDGGGMITTPKPQEAPAVVAAEVTQPVAAAPPPPPPVAAPSPPAPVPVAAN